MIMSEVRLNGSEGVRLDSPMMMGLDSSSASSSTLDLRSRALSTPTTSKHAEEVRILSDNFQDLLKRATKEITKLKGEKRRVEKEYERLLSINEEIAEDLSRVLKKERGGEAERRAIMKANEDLYAEAQRLTNEEDTWEKEREEWGICKMRLETRIRDLEIQIQMMEDDIQEKEIQRLGRPPSPPEEDEEEEENKSEVIESLRDENAKLLELFKTGSNEKEDLLREVSRLTIENESLLSRREIVSGENMQLMLELENQNKRISSLKDDAKNANDRVRHLEKENKDLVSKVKVEKASRTDAMLADRAAERAAELASKNRDLLEWRNQLNDKNQTLLSENAKLKSKCANLEDLLNEESADINEVLELIKNLQLQASNHNCALPQSAIGPISKFRDFKLHPR